MQARETEAGQSTIQSSFDQHFCDWNDGGEGKRRVRAVARQFDLNSVAESVEYPTSWRFLEGVGRVRGAPTPKLSSFRKRNFIVVSRGWTGLLVAHYRRVGDVAMARGGKQGEVEGYKHQRITLLTKYFALFPMEAAFDNP